MPATSVSLAVTFSEAVTVSGGTPTLVLNDGGTATYSSGSGSATLVFTHTVQAGQNIADLAVTSVALNGATLKDAAGNVANTAAAAGYNPPARCASTRRCPPSPRSLPPVRR